MKHMDIKPKNILVRELSSRRASDPGLGNDTRKEKSPEFEVYIADIGIARAYTSVEAASIDYPTMFTRKYAAPEVVDYDRHDQSADMFSLGCVMNEILAVMTGTVEDGKHIKDFSDTLQLALYRNDRVVTALEKVFDANENGDRSYQANINGVHGLLDAISHRWVHPGFLFIDYTKTVQEIIRVDPKSQANGEDVGQNMGYQGLLQERTLCIGSLIASN
jgi:serine/threonine protein kinase